MNRVSPHHAPGRCAFCVWAMMLVITAGCAPGPSNDAPSAAASPDTLALSWTVDTQEGTYGMPESVIYLNAGGLRFPIASGPGMQDMTGEQRVRFEAPEGALAAAGYWAGFGVNVLVVQENGQIRILEAIWDEGGAADAAHEYSEQATIATQSIVTARDEPSSKNTWSACFEGHHDVTTSRFDITVYDNQLTADVQLVIEDDRNAYYTSAQIVGGGLQIGPNLFVEQYISIENDKQSNVAIWHLDDAQDPQVLTVDGNAFPLCSPE